MAKLKPSSQGTTKRTKRTIWPPSSHLAIGTPLKSDLPVSRADKPGATPKDSATATRATAGAADATDSAPLAANPDAAESVGQATENSGERATLAKPVADVEKTSSAVAGGSGETVSDESHQDQQTDRIPSQIAADNHGEAIRRAAATNAELASDAELAAQTQNQNTLAGNGQSMLARDGIASAAGKPRDDGPAVGGRVEG